MMMMHIKTCKTALLAMCLLMGGSSVALADGPTPAAQSQPGVTAVTADSTQAQIAVSVIHAKKGDATGGVKVDPKLERLSRTLTKTFKGYAAFELLDHRTKMSKQGESVELTLPNKAELSYAYLGSEREFLRIQINVGGLKSTVKVKNGGMFFQAGRGYDGGMIILAFSAHAR